MTATSPFGRQPAAEAEAAWSTMRADRRFLWFWLGVATTLSVSGNVGHAWLTVATGPSRWMAIGWAVAPPTLLMLAIHGLPTLSRMLGRDERDKLLTAVVWGVTVGAFGWSAFGIFGFTTAMGVPAEMAWVAPCVIDLSVFGATRGLVLTAPLAARMKAGLSWIHVDPLADGRPIASQAQPAQAATIATIPGTNAVPSHPVSSTGPGGSPLAPAPAARVEEQPAAAPTTAECGGAATPSIARDALAVAEHVVASGAVRKPVETVAAILLAAERESRKAVIAEHIGVHHSVVTKTLDAAESYRRRQFAVVG